MLPRRDTLGIIHHLSSVFTGFHVKSLFSHCFCHNTQTNFMSKLTHYPSSRCIEQARADLRAHIGGAKQTSRTRPTQRKSWNGPVPPGISPGSPRKGERWGFSVASRPSIISGDRPLRSRHQRRGQAPTPFQRWTCLQRARVRKPLPWSNRKRQTFRS